MSPWKAVATSLLTAMCFAFSSASDGLETARPDEPQDRVKDVHGQFVQQITAAYRALEKLSDDQLTLRLTNFQTIGKPSFHRYRVPDVATLPSGDLLNLIHRGKRPDGRPIVEFDWVHVDDPYLLTPGGQKAASASVEQAIALNAQGADPALSKVTFITSFQVTVGYDDRSRDYRAAFLWLSSSPSDFVPSPLDHIVQGLGLALRHLEGE